MRTFKVTVVNNQTCEFTIRAQDAEAARLEVESECWYNLVEQHDYTQISSLYGVEEVEEVEP